MKARLKHTVALFLPPIVVQALRSLCGSASQWTALASKPEWEAVPDSDSVWNTETGWAHRSIAETQIAKWRDFLAASEAPKPLGVSHEATPGTAPDVAPHNAILTFGYALGRALRGGKELSVLDWGGGVGHYAVYARALYPDVVFDYAVKDLDSLCAAGRTVLPDVKFIARDDEAFARQYDFVFASSSLHYTRDFYGLIDRICPSAARYLMVTRLPVIGSHDDFVVIQRPHRYGYMTEYACWFVNRTRLIAFIEARGFRLDREFLLGERPFVLNAPEQCTYSGFLFERRT